VADKFIREIFQPETFASDLRGPNVLADKLCYGKNFFQAPVSLWNVIATPPRAKGFHPKGGRRRPQFARRRFMKTHGAEKRPWHPDVVAAEFWAQRFCFLPGRVPSLHMKNCRGSTWETPEFNQPPEICDVPSPSLRAVPTNVLP